MDKPNLPLSNETPRIIQEYVPGKQITLAHIIASPDESLYRKLGVVGDQRGALAIMTITPSEGAIISADIAMKAGMVDIVFVDRFSGSLVLIGAVGAIETAVKGVITNMRDILGFTPCPITKT